MSINLIIPQSNQIDVKLSQDQSFRPSTSFSSSSSSGPSGSPHSVVIPSINHSPWSIYLYVPLCLLVINFGICRCTMDYYYSTSILNNYSESINFTSNVHISTEDGENLIKFAWYDVWQSGADPRTAQFPLMNGGPWTVLAILGLYLLFVRHYGPWLMKNRPPFDLRPLIFTYNALMMTVNSYFFVMAAIYTRFGYDSWGCTPVDPQLEGDFLWQLKLIWFYFISKFVDLCETIFFILRKKNAQASTLHVIHHTLVPLDVWFGLKYSATTSAAFFPFINSFVHTIMYCYYGLSTLGPQWRPYLWWKKYLTQLQILQLALIAIHCLHLCLLPNCGIPKQIFAIYLPQAILLVYLFVSFFINTYFSTASSKLKAS